MNYFFVKNLVTGKNWTIQAIDKFSAIQIAVEKESYKYLNSQYEAKRSQ